MNLEYNLINRYWHEQKLKLCLGVSSTLVSIVVLLSIPYLFRVAVDVVLPKQDWSALVVVGLQIIGAHLLAVVLILFSRWLILNATKKVICQLRNDLIRRLLYGSYEQYAGLNRGVVHSRIIDDTERVDIMLNALAVNILPAVLAAGALVLLLFYLSSGLTLLLLTIIPLFYLLNRYLKIHLQKRIKIFHDSFENFSRGVRFLLNMYELTLHQNARTKEFKQQQLNTKRLQYSSQAMALMNTAYAQGQDFLVIIATVVVLLGGGLAVQKGSLAIGELASFYIAVMILKTQLRTFFMAVPQCINGREALKRLQLLSDLQSDNHYRGRQKINFQGAVECHKINFAFPGKKLLFRDFSLVINSDFVTGLAGPNGSGKSTLFNLIFGILHPQSGYLTADGIAYEDLEMESLRHQIALVPQNPVFFDGTLEDNLIYGLLSVDPDWMQRVLEWTSSWNWIKALPRQLNSRIGEDGLQLSGGQRQSLAISRALLRKPALLLLDEPTNHLDYQVMRRLLDNLRSEDFSGSICIATHDPRVLDCCDRIISI